MLVTLGSLQELRNVDYRLGVTSGKMANPRSLQYLCCCYRCCCYCLFHFGLSYFRLMYIFRFRNLGHLRPPYIVHFYFDHRLQYPPGFLLLFPAVVYFCFKTNRFFLSDRILSAFFVHFLVFVFFYRQKK